MTSSDLTSTKANPSPFLLQAVDLVKVFGTLRANDGINLGVRPGEIHALLGENGAGKSTLVKMFYGALQPTSGQIFWRGEEVNIASPNKARRLGIGMVFQHFSLFEAMTVVENIALSLPDAYDQAKLARRIAQVSQDYGLALQPYATVADLSVGERQRIEIVRCLLQEPRLLILDEPTAVLTPQEAEQLFKTLRRLSAEGCSVFYITHRLEEVKSLCDTATVLRQGKVVASVDPAHETAAGLARLMVGSDIHQVKSAHGRAAGPTLLKLDHVSTTSEGMFDVALRNVSFEVKGGEVLAIAGVAGNGQTELFDCLSGENPIADNHRIQINGVACGRSGVGQRRKLGAAFVPEERLGHGAVPHLALSENVVLTRHSESADLAGKAFVNRRLAGSIARRVIDLFDVRKGKRDPEARALSGGNLQKFVVGREIDRSPKLLIINQPTWGVDAGAAATVRQALVNLAQAGSAVVVISQDLDEIFEIADRIAVISRGQLSPAVASNLINREQIGLLMAGAHEKSVA